MRKDRELLQEAQRGECDCDQLPHALSCTARYPSKHMVCPDEDGQCQFGDNGDCPKLAEPQGDAARLAELEAWLRRPAQHYWVDGDNWYSCPKAPDGCSDESRGTECDCGAEEEYQKRIHWADEIAALRSQPAGTPAWAVKGPDGVLSAISLEDEASAWIEATAVLNGDEAWQRANGYTCVPVLIVEKKP